VTDYLTQTTLLRLLAVLTLVLAPHLARLPLWESLLLAVIVGWRALIALRQWRLPPTWLRSLIAIACFAAVYANFRSISGLTAGTALLSVMAALKLLEMRARRDVMVVVLLMYFILVTHFLFAQELWTIAYLLFSAVAITALLMDCNHAGDALPPRALLRMASIMVAQALPLMLVFFVLFPRIPGPLWSLPSDSGAGKSGLSDKMSPGDISALMQSDEVAFRVRFLDRVPAMRERYWRGPVFDTFDGRGWQASQVAGMQRAVPVELQGQPLRYEMTLEPSGVRWMFALDLPSPLALPPESALNYSDLLLAARPLQQRLVYQTTAYTHYRLQPELHPREHQHFLQLPEDYNPRSRALMQQWRAQGLDAAAIVNKVLQMYRQENFVYTLQPPRLARDSVDDFLFNTRQGFCEHYASSFTFLMRAAGIPARVVTGYQGGEKNELGDYYVVRQYDAHAWSEVWLADQGWVRVDPTGAVAPERVEHGLSSAMSLAQGLPGFLAQRKGLRLSLNMRWDWVNQKWNAWVLAYGPDLQADFLRNFGIEDWSQMILVMTVLITLATAVVSLLLLRQFSPAVPQDRALRLWQRALRKLEKAGLQQRPEEGPCDFTERVMQQRPALTAAMTRMLAAYLKLRYLQEPDRAIERELELAVSALKPRAD
jgi:transglutaminase-like putative cysteine protease